MSLSREIPVSSRSFMESDHVDDLPTYSAATLSLPSDHPDSSSSRIHNRLFAPKRSFGGLFKQLYNWEAREQAKCPRAQPEELTEEEKKVAQKMIDQYWDRCLSMGY